MQDKLPLKYKTIHSITNLELARCSVTQGSVLGPLRLLLYQDDLQNTSKVLHKILLADDTPTYI